MSEIRNYISKLTNKEDLNCEDIQRCLQIISKRGATPAQIAAFLTALKVKGETINEIAATRNYLTKHLNCTQSSDNFLNISFKNSYLTLAAAIILNSLGYKVALPFIDHPYIHSNIANLLENLGIPVKLSNPQLEEIYNKTGIYFLIERSLPNILIEMHTLRIELGIETLLELIEPLYNLSSCKYYLIESTYNSHINVIRELHAEFGATFYQEKDILNISLLKDNEIYLHSINILEFFEDINNSRFEINESTFIDILNSKNQSYLPILISACASLLLASGAYTDIKQSINHIRNALTTGQAYNNFRHLTDSVNRVLFEPSIYL
jgi:anthranilate phosphoribosyltransferase